MTDYDTCVKVAKMALDQTVEPGASLEGVELAVQISQTWALLAIAAAIKERT